MPALLLECLTPFVVVFALIGAVIVSIRKRPDLWPPSFLAWERTAEARAIAVAARLQTTVRSAQKPADYLGPLHLRLRQARRRFERWAAQPGNGLTLRVLIAAAVVLVAAVFGLSAPEDSLWHRLAAPAIVMAIAVVAVDALFRMRGDLLEKERVIRQMGSRNNHLALDAARTVIERGWHRDGSLAGICFDRADLRGLTMSSARLASSSFMYAGLRDAELMFANLRSARLGSSDLRSANLSFSDLESAVLGLADLENASLGRCSLRDAHLEGANLRNAFLEHAEMDGVHLEQAIYDSKTRWPLNFVPPADAINWDTLGDTEREWFRQWRWYLGQDLDP